MYVYRKNTQCECFASTSAETSCSPQATAKIASSPLKRRGMLYTVLLAPRPAVDRMLPQKKSCPRSDSATEYWGLHNFVA